MLINRVVANCCPGIGCGKFFAGQQFLTFLLNDEPYAIGILHIKEIIEYGSLAAVPMMPACVRGVINLRGVIVPIVDMRLKFNQAQANYDAFTVVIVLNIGTRVVGMVVDSVSDVTTLTPEQVKPAPEMGAAFGSDYMIGLGTIDERMLIARERLVDTLMLARRKHPAGPNRLDDLCARYGIDNSRRSKHGALLDSELLAEVYLELSGGRQRDLGLAPELAGTATDGTAAPTGGRDACAAATCTAGRPCGEFSVLAQVNVSNQRVQPLEVTLLASVFVVAACGLVYELAAGALASYLLGDSVLQFSTIIGAYLFAMGIGSWLSRFFDRQLPNINAFLTDEIHKLT